MVAVVEVSSSCLWALAEVEEVASVAVASEVALVAAALAVVVAAQAGNERIIRM